MSTLTRDPLTGAYSFKDPNQVINKTTGQTAQGMSSLPMATAPTNVAQVNPLPSVQMPTNTPVVGSVSNALASTSGTKTQLEVLQKQEADRAELARTEADKLQSQQDQAKTSILDIFKSTPTAAETRESEFAKIGIDPATYFADQKAKIAEIDTLNQEYNTFKAEVERQKAAVEGQGRGVPIDLLNNQIAQIDRNAAPKLNMISANVNSKAATLQALQGNFNEARSLVNEAVADATADTKFKLDTLTTFYNMNQDAISRLDSKYQSALTNSINLAKEEYDNQRADKKEIGELMLANSKAGITMSDTLEEAYAKFSANPLVNTDVVKLDNGNTVLINTQTGETIRNLGGAGSATTANVPTEYSGMVDAVGNLFPTAVRGNAVKQSLAQAVNSGDFPGAYAQIANAVGESLTGETKTRFNAARIDYNVMLGLRDSVNEFVAAGGDTGLLKGTAESIERKLGQVTNPLLTKLAVQLQREFQQYRVEMTGAAFGAGESRDYASVNPSSNKSLDLNMAVIDGALGQLQNRVTSTINTVVPDASKIYSKVNPAPTTSLANVGISEEDEKLFDSTVGNSSSGGFGGFFKSIWSGLTGK